MFHCPVIQPNEQINQSCNSLRNTMLVFLKVIEFLEEFKDPVSCMCFLLVSLRHQHVFNGSLLVFDAFLEKSTRFMNKHQRRSHELLRKTHKIK